MHHLETNGLNKQRGGINYNVPVKKKKKKYTSYKMLKNKIKIKSAFIIINIINYLMHKITTILLSKYKYWHKKTKLFQNCKELS